MIKQTNKPASVIGWMGSLVQQLARKRTWVGVISSKTEVIIAQTYPVDLLLATPQQVLGALRQNCLGSGAKAITTGVMAAVPVDITHNLGNIRSFGVRIKIANAVTSFRYGAYTVRLLDGATTLGDVIIRPATNVVDVVICGIDNTGGRAALKSIANPQVSFLVANSSYAAGDSVTAETLNERDLGDLRL